MIEAQTLKAWFFREVLPLEPALMRFLRRNWRNRAELMDLRQDIYARVYDAARAGLPLRTKPFLFAAARNHLINCAKRAQIVSIEQVSELEALNIAVDHVTPERYASARDELKRVQAGLKRLPPRCREVVVLRKIEGLSQRQAAQHMGVSEDTVERQMVQGMRALVDFMLGGSGRIKRGADKEVTEEEKKL